jgi:hypothetical protein
MAMKWLWWAPLGVLIVGAGLLGLRLGYVALNVSETDVINAYAAQYVERSAPNGRLTDCHAVPGDGFPGIWIVVSCRAPGGAWEGVDFYANRLGGLEHVKAIAIGAPATNPTAPEA